MELASQTVDRDTIQINKSAKSALLAVLPVPLEMLEAARPVPQVTTSSKEAVYNNAHPHTTELTLSAKPAPPVVMSAQMALSARDARSES
jgi:hypothetical protein